MNPQGKSRGASELLSRALYWAGSGAPLDQRILGAGRELVRKAYKQKLQERREALWGWGRGLRPDSIVMAPL